MKILHLIQKKQLRGAETFASQLANHQIMMGHEVKMVSLFSGTAKLHFRGEIISLNRSGKSRLLDVQGWKQIAQQIREFQPDIVQANAGDTLKYAVLSKKIYGWKQPVLFRNASMVSLYIKNPLIKALNGWLYKQTTHIISVSKKSKQDLINLFPFIKQRATVIPVGINCDELTWAKLAWPSNKKNIVHVGGFTFEKNHEGLLRIFAKFREKVNNVQLHLVGDGIQKNAIELKAAELALNDHITFYGYQPNPLDYIASADVLVLPSIIEGLPGVILEAFYCKKPVIAYNVGGISEIVKNGKTGWLVEKNDEERFADAIEEVFKAAPDHINKITDEAYKMVVEEYDNKVIAERFLEEYERVLRRNMNGGS